MNEFVSQKINSILNLNTTYALSSCISFVQNSGNYFADCCIKSQNGNNFYRFINNQIMPININNIYQYEPQVLIYELKNQNNNNNKKKRRGDLGNLSYIYFITSKLNK